jgi:hypothetical protein
MDDITEEIREDLTIKKSAQYHKLAGCNVVVDENITARLFGDVNDLHLKNGSIVFMHGKVTGTVRNENGILHLYSK